MDSFLEFTVAQKLEAGAGKLKINISPHLIFYWRFFFLLFFLELFSIDGAIRVISDDFSISLLNPESELYKYKADKYENMVSRDSTNVQIYVNIIRVMHFSK